MRCPGSTTGTTVPARGGSSARIRESTFGLLAFRRPRGPARAAPLGHRAPRTPLVRLGLAQGCPWHGASGLNASGGPWRDLLRFTALNSKKAGTSQRVPVGTVRCARGPANQ